MLLKIDDAELYALNIEVGRGKGAKSRCASKNYKDDREAQWEEEEGRDD